MRLMNVRDPKQLPPVQTRGEFTVYPKQVIEFICECFDMGITVKNISEDTGIPYFRVKTIIGKMKKTGRLGIRKKGGDHKNGNAEWSIPPNYNVEVTELLFLSSYTANPTSSGTVQNPTDSKELSVPVGYEVLPTIENTKEPQLSELLSDLSFQEGEEAISTRHKEMLIEVMHKLIC